MRLPERVGEVFDARYWLGYAAIIFVRVLGID